MSLKALIVGGSGPTGLFLAKGLLERKYAVAIFHRGTHELIEMPSAVEHIHGDPHFLESIDECLGGRTFDLVIATYGRIRVLVEAVRRRTCRIIAVSGAPGYRGYLVPNHNKPYGLPVPVSEGAAVVDDPELHRFSYLIAETEKTVMMAHSNADFQVTCFRYPQIYGPHQVNPFEWLVIRRILDRRPHIILADGGLTLETRGYSENVAHGVLLAVDKSDESAGQIYNLGDDRQLTVRQWVETISNTMGYNLEIMSMPEILAKPAWCLLPFQGPTSHRLMDTRKIQKELGYSDKVPVEEALRRTVEWYLAHPPSVGGEEEKRLQDPFDYQAEDRIIELYRKAVAEIDAKAHFELEGVVHPYAHPLTPGEKRDHRDR
jgi:nucleoside-diphosphate-sugar epimerase